jgi:hypothetical protein
VCTASTGRVCIGGACGCQSTADCSNQVANQCNNNRCQCNAGPSCNLTTQRCVSSGCKLLSGQNCTAPTDCASGICTNSVCG